uniref:Uncharacterized protein n=1 Tax=Leersia perrieri TaxID=77586 RepID=A0A0D9VK76_9ORYZ
MASIDTTGSNNLAQLPPPRQSAGGEAASEVVSTRNNAITWARIRSRRPRGLMAQRLSPNYSFWAAHRWRGTWPMEIDFLGVNQGVQLPVTETSSEDSAPAPAPVQGDHGSFRGSN